MPRLHVITPIYNAAEFLPAAIESIRNQTFTDFVWTLIDDASTDSSCALAHEYAANDERIRVLALTHNVGVGAARNQALRDATEEYIAFFDADDIAAQDRFATQISFLDQNPTVDLAASAYTYIDNAGNQIGDWSHAYDADELAHALPLENVIHSPTVVMRNRGYLFREKFLIAEDYDLWLRMLSDGRTMVVLPHKLIAYRIHGHSLTHVYDKNIRHDSLQARALYFERKTSGRDSYDALVLGANHASRDRANLISAETRSMKLLFKSQNVSELRGRFIQFIRHYGFMRWPCGYLYFLASFLPRAIRTQLIRFLWRQ
jgi:glycosyltransferase involved in cell wall biosynthesis